MESNPGADTAAMLQQLNAIAKDIKYTKSVKIITNDRLSAIKLKLKSIRTLQKNISACQDKITELEANVRTITKKLDDLENRSRWSNLIVYGIKKQDNENNES